MKTGYLCAACVSPRVTVADCMANADAIAAEVKRAEREHISLLAFPELSITAYTCGDLFLQSILQEQAAAALGYIAEQTAGCSVLFFVGLPAVFDSCVYNCAAAVQRGRVLAVIPKTFIPEHSESCESRWFAPAPVKDSGASVYLGGSLGEVPFGARILFRDKTDKNILIAAEIGGDLWAPAPPSVEHALNGASVIVNLSASSEIIGRAEYRRMMVCSHSAKLSCAYIYANAGAGESSSDMVFGGHNIIAENGAVLQESKPFGDFRATADIDTLRLVQERRRMGMFAQCRRRCGDAGDYRVIPADLKKNDDFEFRTVSPLPFVPADSLSRRIRCREVLELQARGLAGRIEHVHARTAVIGLSGGLDSTLALLVAAEAYKLLGRDAKDITAVTMPCFGTTERTYGNAFKLAEATGVSFTEINIEKAVLQHFSDIGHSSSDHDVVYENSQARERTQVLMDIANKTGGLVVGTGDLSELALGWATYNGDHMSMYGVNASIPKTLIRYLVLTAAEDAFDVGQKALADVLRDILDTPVSPELLPADGGKIAQKTEELVGPYELHDFFLYYMMRWGFPPTEIYRLARSAFKNTYEPNMILHWLKIFYKRFFSQQFKRNCLPDGAKVGSVCLSPRGTWHMPSDASCRLWLSEADALEEV